MQPQPTLSLDAQRAELESVYYEAHKDAYGWRDRSDRSHWSVERYEREIDACVAEMRREHYAEGVSMFEAAATYHREVNALLDAGAPDRVDAVRWWYEANGFEEQDEDFDAWAFQRAEGTLYGRGFPIPMWRYILPEFMPAYTDPY